MAKRGEKTGAGQAEEVPGVDLDLALIKDIAKQARARGFITLDQLNKTSPLGKMTFQQIEEVKATLGEMGITVVDTDIAHGDNALKMSDAAGGVTKPPPQRKRAERPAPAAADLEGPLSSEEVRAIQVFLNEIPGVKVLVDGLLGPQTTDAFQFYRAEIEKRAAPLLRRRLAALIPPPAQEAAPDRPPHAWIFHAPDSETGWTGRLWTGQTIFWHEPASGDAKRDELQRGDTVLALAGTEFIGDGVLLADDQFRFSDSGGRRCWPVALVEIYPAAFSHRLFEHMPPVELLSHLDGVSPVSPNALAMVNDLRWQEKRDALPRPRGATGNPRYGSQIRDALADPENRDIRPDVATAMRLKYTGPVRSWEPRSEAASPTPPVGEPLAQQAPGPSRKRARKPAQAPAPAKADAPSPDPAAKIDARIPFVLDAPKDSEDQLERGPFALFLAQRLHLIWCQMNGHAPGESGTRTAASPADSDTFIVHVDSPWGGGKTTFANFIARVLDPREQTLDPKHFLRSSLAPTVGDDELAAVPLEEVFVPPYAREGAEGWEQWSGARQPWVIARYNAWRDQYVQPPWWQVFLKIQSAVTCEVRRDAGEALRRGELLRADNAITRWLAAKWERIAYQVWNRKLQGQLLLWLFISGLLGLLWAGGVLDALAGASRPAPGAVPDAKRMSDWLGLGVAALGLGGASVAAMFTIISQSLAPDLDFTAEHKQIGVQDPIGRFRRSFDRILRATDRPVLLIVDDLDRCEPGTVVELMRGFQTIIRSPRLFVLLLGDRAWIENAHDVVHRELSAVREGEDGLGARFVQKMIQLSFRLPTMKPEARTRFAHSVLGDKPAGPAAKEVAAVLRQLDKDVSEIVGQAGSVGGKEAEVAQVVEKAKAALPDTLTRAETRTAVDLAEKLVNVKIVASAGADTALQRSVYNAVTRLITSLPNNPRQIKRIFMAFATYEVVGRVYFGYQLTEEGPDGKLRARRWRQLAMWVTLAIEWPETWRAVARRPGLLDAAYAEPKARKRADAALLAPLSDTEKADAAVTLERLRSDRALIGLLSRDTGASAPKDDFAGTVMETEAIYEFNRIIWEPGFELEARKAG